MLVTAQLRIRIRPSIKHRIRIRPKQQNPEPILLLTIHKPTEDCVRIRHDGGADVSELQHDQNHAGDTQAPNHDHEAPEISGS
mgnify:FL=1